MNTEQVAKRLVELCREGKYEQAQQELYGNSVYISQKEGLPPGALGNAQGIAAIREKGRKWQGSIEAIHGGSVSDPVIAGDWFSVAMGIDATYKGMGRMDMQEICVFRVREGKIVHEQFFYDVG